MSPDATNIVASIARSLEPDRSPSASQRASEVAQGQIADESLSMLHLKRTSATDAVSRNKIRHDHEERRRRFERHKRFSYMEEDNDGDEPHIDVVV